MLGAVLIISLGVSFAALLFGFFSATPYVGYFSSSSSFLTWLAWLSGFTAFVCFASLILFFLFRMFTSYRLKKPIRNGLLGTGLLAIILCAFSSLFHIQNYAEKSTIKESQNLVIQNNKIRISQQINDELSDGMNINLGEPILNRRGLFCDDIRVNLYKSNEPEIKIEKVVSSHGRSRSEAKKIAGHVISNIEVIENEIKIPEVYKIKRGNKYRGQDVRYNIYIPSNKEIEIDDDMHWTVWKNEFSDNDRASRRSNKKKREEAKKLMQEDQGLTNPTNPVSPEKPSKPADPEKEMEEYMEQENR